MDKIFRSLMVLGLALVAGSGLAASGWDSVAESANAVAGGWAGVTQTGMTPEAFQTLCSCFECRACCSIDPNGWCCIASCGGKF